MFRTTIVFFQQTHTLTRHITYTTGEFPLIGGTAFSDNKHNLKNLSFNKQKSNASIEIITVKETCSFPMNKNTNVFFTQLQWLN